MITNERVNPQFLQKALIKKIEREDKLLEVILRKEQEVTCPACPTVAATKIVGIVNFTSADVTITTTSGVGGSVLIPASKVGIIIAATGEGEMFNFVFSGATGGINYWEAFQGINPVGHEDIIDGMLNDLGDVTLFDYFNVASLGGE